MIQGRDPSPTAAGSGGAAAERAARAPAAPKTGGAGRIADWLKRPVVSLAFALALAFALRFAQLAIVRDDIAFLHPQTDAMEYRFWAIQILHGDWLGRDIPVFYQAPLYPYFLAVLFAIFGPSHLAVAAAQIVLSVLTVGILHRLALDLFGPTAALLAGVMAAVYGLFVFYSSVLLGETLILFFDSALLMLLVSAIRRPRMVKFALAGVCFGLSAATRANVLIFAPFAGLAIASGLGLGQWRRWLPAGLVFAGTLFAVLSPITLHNRIVGGDWVLVSANAGANLFIGNSRSSDGLYGGVPTYHDEPIGSSVEEQRIMLPAIAARELGRDELLPSEVSRFWLERALLEIRSDTARWLRVMRNKAIHLVNAYEVPNNRNYEFDKQFSPLLRAPLLSFGVLFPLGLLGLVVCGRAKGARSVLPGFVLAHVIALLLFFVNARYRLVLVPPLIVSAAAFLVWVRSWLRHGRYTPLLVSAVALYALYVVVHIPVPRWSFRGEWMNVGNAYRARGEPDAALESYERALALSPDYYHALWRKGGVLADLGRTSEAREVFERGLELAEANEDSLYVERFRSQLPEAPVR